MKEFLETNSRIFPKTADRSLATSSFPKRTTLNPISLKTFSRLASSSYGRPDRFPQSLDCQTPFRSQKSD